MTTHPEPASTRVKPTFHQFHWSAVSVILVMATACLAAAGLVACSARPILVGVPLGLTGLASTISVHSRNGIELALSWINAAGGIRGRPLQLLIENDHDNPDSGLQAATKLVEQVAIALVGHMAIAPAIKSVDYLTEHWIPLISPTIPSTDYSGKDDYFFRTIGPNDAQGRTLAQEALRRGYRTASVVLNIMNSSYTTRYGEEPEFGALYGYEAMSILAAAIRKARKTDGPAIKKALLSTRSYHGLHNEIVINKYGDTDRPYYLYEVRNGVFVRLP
ncbi:MAG: hypothetical protein A3J97_06990 [Spirochaetes bacterium RIFOXYC1_FULL_54_7]|nr:MAG: hypothetical protein A3J97_06990 [Spirochaetes bacterium RIFOXYC1_FULL_54_7]